MMAAITWRHTHWTIRRKMTFCGYFSSAPLDPLSEIVVPDSDGTTTGWSATGGGSLYQDLDDRNNSFWAQSSPSTATCPARDTKIFDVGLANPSSVPGDASVQGMRMLFQISHDDALTASTGDSADWTIRLFEGVTEIAFFAGYASTKAVWSAELVAILSPAEVSSITDHNNLSIQVEVGMCTATGDIEAYISYAQLEYYAL
jgi:hypothetical protein